MGKPYADEMAALPETYRKALRFDIEALAAAITAIRAIPLVIVGSGGSLSAAHFAASLHHLFSAAPAHAVTPLLLARQSTVLRHNAIMIISAGGSNPDVMAAFKSAIAAEPAHAIVLCASKDSPLALLARRFHWVTVVEFEPPTGRDGFLATNSLLAFGTLLLRAYRHDAQNRHDLPSTLVNLIAPRTTSFPSSVHAIGNRTSSLWSREHLLVLYGPDTEAAAHDIESKFTEAALAAVQLADFRNFGHGRHHWLAKRGSSSAILALRTGDDSHLARATLKHIPKGIPIADLSVPGTGPVAGLAAIVQSIVLAAHCGRARGIDPGRPGVPPFGRRLYHLRSPARPLDRVGRKSDAATCAIERKAGVPLHLLPVSSLQRLHADYIDFCARLRSAQFDGLVLDYDGTLCDPSERLTGPCVAVIAQLTRLLGHGIRLVVVTGRGKSVRNDLRRAFADEMWPNVSVGYYNGAQYGMLADDRLPYQGIPIGALKEAAALLRAHPLLQKHTKFECRKAQISLQSSPSFRPSEILDFVIHVLPPCLRSQLTVVRSGHSVDVLAPGVSKVHAVESASPPLQSTLSIGDAGRWPGNDFDLLAQGLSLSVNEVSPDPSTCWNLAPRGIRGSQALLYYLRLLHLSRSRGRTRMRV